MVAISSLDNYMFTKMVVGCIIIGIGFGAPTVINKNENLPMPVRVIIHMGIGCAVYAPGCFCRRLDGRSSKHRTGDPECDNTSWSGFWYLVPVHAVL